MSALSETIDGRTPVRAFCPIYEIGAFCGKAARTSWKNPDSPGSIHSKDRRAPATALFPRTHISPTEWLMQSNSPGRHRKPTRTAKFAARTALTAGAAVTAVLVSGGAATAATPDAAPMNPLPCTGYPIDSVGKAILGSYCGS